MEDWIGDLWKEYRDEVLGLYREPNAWILRDNLTNASLDRVNELAEQIEGACLAAINDGDTEEAPTALVASAAVDANVAADVLVAELTLEGPADEELRNDALARVEDEGPPPPEAERMPLPELLLIGDEAFLGGRSGACPPESARERSQEAIDELLERAVPVARGFAVGTASFGGGELIALLGQVDVLREVAEAAQDLFRRGMFLLRRAVRKLMEALGAMAGPAELAAGCAWDELTTALNEIVERLSLHAVRAITRAALAEAELDQLAPALEQMTQDKLDSLSSQLDKLCGGYRKRMKCAGALRTALRIAAPPVAVATGGTAVPVVAGLNASGLTYVLYSLAAHLGTAPARSLKGVPTLAREAL